MRDFNNKKVSVIGLGISNTPLIKWLLDRGSRDNGKRQKEL